jgi:hypothetical protein
MKRMKKMGGLASLFGGGGLPPGMNGPGGMPRMPGGTSGRGGYPFGKR